MGVSRIILIQTCVDLLAEPLSYLGYSIREQPPVMGEQFWFEKPGQTDRDKYKVIEFQPSGFSNENLFDLAINLIKGNLVREINDQSETNEAINLVNPDYLVRLSPRIWDENSTIPDYWWHINTFDELVVACQDILEKLLNWGIPFLEDDSKTFKDWLPP